MPNPEVKIENKLNGNKLIKIRGCVIVTDKDGVLLEFINTNFSDNITCFDFKHDGFKHYMKSIFPDANSV